MINKKRNSKFKSKENSFLKNEFYKRVFYIVLCIIPIIIFADDKGTFRLVPLPFLIIGMYQLIMIVGLSQSIIDEFFPPKTYFEHKSKPIDSFVYYFSTVLFFVGLVSLLFEIKNFDNTIQGTHLFWKAGGIGIGLALVVTLLLKAITPSVYYESKRRFTVYFGLFIGLFLLTTATTGFINHHFAEKHKLYKKYLISSKGNSGSLRSRSKEYFINLKIDAYTEERFTIEKSLYDEFSEGEEIVLCLVKGKFGYDYVTEFTKIENHKKN